MDHATYALRQSGDVCSPALIYYRDLIEANTRAAIELAGGAGRLWPHVKSHKMADMVRMQMAMGIDRFKCATIAELNMAAACGPRHLLMAYPLVGPNVALFLDAAERHPGTRFYALGDSIEAMELLSRGAAARGLAVPVLADVNLGMDRTGVDVDRLADFYRACARLPGISPVGLHCYDGHVHEVGLAERCDRAAPPLRRALAVAAALAAEGFDTSIVIAGGSPTFPVHAREAGVFLSPGTVFLWDAGYARNLPDLPFQPAAAVLARVISHPAEGLFTLDVGSKAIAADPAGSRGVIAGLEDAQPVRQSEEHWVFRMPPGREADRPAIGAVRYVIPTHICPTTSLYAQAVVAAGGEVVGAWPVTARDRCALAQPAGR